MADSRITTGAQNRAAKPRRTKTLARTRPCPSEHEEQAILCAWLDFKRIGYFAVPNGARVRPSQARRMKREGMRAGAPDLVLERLSADMRPIAVEMKRAGGRPSPAQILCHVRLRACGWYVVVGRGADDAIDQLRVILGA